VGVPKTCGHYDEHHKDEFCGGILTAVQYGARVDHENDVRYSSIDEIKMKAEANWVTISLITYATPA
jgi:hypothetical protein